MPEPIVKVMSISHSEFLASLVHIGGVSEWPDGHWSVELAGGGRAALRLETLPAVRLGGLLELPRARVSIAFNGGSPSARTAFLHRFELAFQRGGG